MEITLGQQYNVGEKVNVMLYTYINRHARTAGFGFVEYYILRIDEVVDVF